MDSARVYTKRILDDLRIASEYFSDVELVLKEQKIETNSLVLAALSGMMNSALKDLIYENIDEKIQVIIPDSEIDFGLVSSLFRDVLFSLDEDLELEGKYQDVLDYLDIKSSFHSFIKTNTPIGVATSTQIKHVCEFCNKSFNLKKLLSRHVRTFHIENPYKCKDCGRLCRNQSELKIHERVHTKERPHKCTQCQNCYTQVSHLNEHIKNVHYGSNDFISGKNICEICGLILSSRGAVQRHMKQHEDVPHLPLSPPSPLTPSPPPSPSISVLSTLPPAPSPDRNFEATIGVNELKIVDRETEKSEEKLTTNSQKLVCDFEGCGKVLKTHSSLKLHLK